MRPKKQLFQLKNSVFLGAFGGGAAGPRGAQRQSALKKQLFQSKNSVFLGAFGGGAAGPRGAQRQSA